MVVVVGIVVETSLVVACTFAEEFDLFDEVFGPFGEAFEEIVALGVGAYLRNDMGLLSEYEVQVV
jgi:hypothetical protein